MLTMNFYSKNECLSEWLDFLIVNRRPQSGDWKLSTVSGTMNSEHKTTITSIQHQSITSSNKGLMTNNLNT